MGKLDHRLREELNDIIAYKRGKLKLRSELIEIPDPPAQFTDASKDIKSIQEEDSYSQALLAKI